MLHRHYGRFIYLSEELNCKIALFSDFYGSLPPQIDGSSRGSGCTPKR